MIGTDCIGNCQSNYHTITTTSTCLWYYLVACMSWIKFVQFFFYCLSIFVDSWKYTYLERMGWNPNNQFKPRHILVPVTSQDIRLISVSVMVFPLCYEIELTKSSGSSDYWSLMTYRLKVKWYNFMNAVNEVSSKCNNRFIAISQFHKECYLGKHCLYQVQIQHYKNTESFL